MTPEEAQTMLEDYEKLDFKSFIEQYPKIDKDPLRAESQIRSIKHMVNSLKTMKIRG